MRSVLTGCVVVLAANGGAMAKEATVDQATDPVAILRDVSARGAAAVVRDFYDDRVDWDSMLHQVERADEAWLRVAVALRPGTDAGSTSELHDSVVAALAADPATVLRVAVPDFPLSDLCSGRHDPLATYDAAVTEVDKMVAAVAAIESPQLSKDRDECLRALRASRGDLKRFFARE